MEVTSLSEYMAAEQMDASEPASFYVAGVEGWEDWRIKMLRAQQQRGLIEDALYPAPEWDEAEDE